MNVVLNASDRQALLVAVLSAADKLADLRISEAMSSSDYRRAEKEERKLRHLLDVLIAHDIELEGEEVENAVNDIKQATSEVKGALETIKDIKAGIHIAVALIQVAGGVLSKDPGAVISGCKSIYDTIAELQKHPPTGSTAR